jgi:hypothetical protein
VVKSTSLTFQDEEIDQLCSLFRTYAQMCQKLPEDSYNGHMNFIARTNDELRHAGYTL